MRSRFIVSLSLSLVVGMATVVLPFEAAYAQDACSAAYTHDQWRGEMDKVDAAFQQFDLNKVRIEIDAVWRHVGCLDTVARPGHLARFARQRAMLYFFDQDEETATRWGLLARYTAPDFPWSSDFAEDHPFRSMLTGATDLPIGGPDNAGFKTEKKTLHVFLNGHWITEPKARAEIPNLMQFTDKKGVVTSTFWQDGAAFPEDIIGPPVSAPAAPKWFVERTTYEDAGGAAVFAATKGSESPEVAVATDSAASPAENKPPEATTANVMPVEAPPVVPAEKPPETVAAAPPPATPAPIAMPPAANATEPPPERPVESSKPVGPSPANIPPPAVAVRPETPSTTATGAPAAARSTTASRQKKGSPLSVPRLAVGGGLGLVAVVLGVVSNSAANQFYDTSTDTAELVGLRGRANTLLVGAGLAGTAALGVGVTAFIAQDGPGLGIHARW